MSTFIPVDRLHETPTLIAFHHPRPTHTTHILLVPKRVIPTMAALNAEHCDFLADVFSATKHIIADLNLADAGYSLVCNGGKSQDVAQLHFHLISDTPIDNN